MNVNFGQGAQQPRFQAQKQGATAPQGRQANSVKFGFEPITCCAVPAACCGIVPALLIVGGIIVGVVKGIKGLGNKARGGAQKVGGMNPFKRNKATEAPAQNTQGTQQAAG